MRRSDGSSRQAEAWTQMLHALRDYKSQHGSCEVPTIYKPNPRLGRWVAAQRYRGKCGDMPTGRRSALEQLGFSWTPGGNAWEQSFDKLREFKSKHGHCDVPQIRNGDRELSAWVQHQRTRHRKGVLEPDRVERLEALGFSWSVGRGHGQSPKPMELYERRCPIESAEKLYSFGHGHYVQHDGNGQIIETLELYRQQHAGEFPPFIPLPIEPVVFMLGPREINPLELPWEGHGPLPEKIMEYVSRDGTLPPYRYLRRSRHL